MQYKALYRKYRPIDFNDVIGQEPIIKTLTSSIREDKVGHAYLFAGSRGTGKTSVAKIFAKTINCENLTDGKPCYKCNICATKNFDDLTDIIEIDAASNNGVDEIREIKNKASLVPVMCKYKVYIIDEVHMLSMGAFNALLKTLEEPPSHAIFILATTEPEKIPMTIISRCQRFDFKKIQNKEVQDRLEHISKKEKINIEEDCLEEISKMADGSLRDAIGLLDQLNTYSEEPITIKKLYSLTGNIDSKLLFDIIEKIFTENVCELIETYDELCNSGKDFKKIAESMLEILVNILTLKNAKQYFDNKEIRNKEEIRKIEKKVNREKLNYLIDQINVLLENIKKSSNPNVLFELFLLKMANLEEVKIANEVVVDEKKDVIKETESKTKSINSMSTSKISNEVIKNEVSFLLKEAIINNTIALAEGQYKKEIKNALSSLDKFLLESKYKNIATILMDSTVNAASIDHLLLTYKYDGMVLEHDRNIKKIEKLINEMVSRKYKIVAVTEAKWNELRPKFIELKNANKKIELMEEIEDETIGCSIENETEYDDLLNQFGNDIIEMEE